MEFPAQVLTLFQMNTWKFQQTEEKNNHREGKHISFLFVLFCFVLLFSFISLSLTSLPWSERVTSTSMQTFSLL